MPSNRSRSRHLLQLLLEQVDDYALFLLTPDGVVSDWLPGAQDIFGFESAEIVGRPARVLALVSDLVERHGGSVQARSDGRNKGSVFTVRLPLHGRTGS